jgi:hypothetical protein
MDAKWKMIETVNGYQFIRDECPDLGRNEIIDLMLELKKLDGRIYTQCMAYCNGWIDSDLFDKRTAKLYARLDEISKLMGIEITVNQDPRGSSVCLHLKNHSNAMDSTYRVTW